MPTVAIDILTPKQALFFHRVSKHLVERGVDTSCTTRVYFEVQKMILRLGVEARIVGRHGGASPLGKLKAYAERVKSLASYYAKLRPGLVLSFSSPEAARAAYGLGITHFSVNDAPHAEAVARLTIPLSKRLFTPWVIPKEAWSRFGIGRGSIETYRALDPAAWLKTFKPDNRVLDDLGLDAARPIVTIRPEEHMAAYLAGRRGATREMAWVAKMLLREQPRAQVVVASRYGAHRFYSNVFGKGVTVSRGIIDGASLLSFSKLFVGGGGTMTAESALLGTPTISYYPGRPYFVEQYLLRERLIRKARGPRMLYRMASELLRTPGQEVEEMRARARRHLESMEDPAERVARRVAEVLQAGQR